MRKKKEYNLLQKIRGALRDIYRFSPMRREAIKKVAFDREKSKWFACRLCSLDWPIQMAEVDHEPPLGPFLHFVGDDAASLGGWASNLFFGPTQVICKLCHKKKSAAQRRKK